MYVVHCLLDTEPSGFLVNSIISVSLIKPSSFRYAVLRLAAAAYTLPSTSFSANFFKGWPFYRELKDRSLEVISINSSSSLSKNTFFFPSEVWS